MPESEAEKPPKVPDMKRNKTRTSAVQLHDNLNLLALPLISLMAVSGLLGLFDPFKVTAAMVRVVPGGRHACVFCWPDCSSPAADTLYCGRLHLDCLAASMFAQPSIR